MTAQDELRIFQNILAQSPEGLNDPNLIGKFSKAKFQLHMMDSMGQLQSQMTMPQSPQGTISSQTTNPIPTEQTPLNQPQNQGQGELNLPPNA